MPAYVCTACGMQYPDSAAPPARCLVCEEEPQSVQPTGQSWTTRDGLRARHFTSFGQHEEWLIGIGTQPNFAIGQRALLLCTPHGNVLWDCIALIDDATVAL